MAELFEDDFAADSEDDADDDFSDLEDFSEADDFSEDSAFSELFALLFDTVTFEEILSTVLAGSPAFDRSATEE